MFSPLFYLAYRHYLISSRPRLDLIGEGTALGLLCGRTVFEMLHPRNLLAICLLGSQGNRLREVPSWKPIENLPESLPGEASGGCPAHPCCRMTLQGVSSSGTCWERKSVLGRPAPSSSRSLYLYTWHWSSWQARNSYRVHLHQVIKSGLGWEKHYSNK